MGYSDVAERRVVRWRSGLDCLGAPPRLERLGALRVQIRLRYTLRRVDRLQPALAVVSLISTIAFAITVDGSGRTLAGLAAAGFGLILVGSGAWLVPLQRRLVAPGSDEAQVDADNLRRQWFRGHQLRAMVALLSFILSVIALVS